ncbi:MAG: NAD(P)-dependent oxidoreductase [bacterium]|nr:NAD(P)-dependent oxidoreductase [bacterium]
MGAALVTGGSGFLGSLLLGELVRRDWECVNIDLQPGVVHNPRVRYELGDIRSTETLDRLFSRSQFDVVFHCAAVLAHTSIDERFLWTSNVDGTLNIAERARKFGVPKVVFTSSNCLWGERFSRPVLETDQPNPVEVYGRSKWEGEQVLADYSSSVNTVILRCPTIIEAGRLGLLSILFEFIDGNRTVWVVGDGSNRYQFIYAGDLIEAMLRAVDFDGSDVFGIGSDNVKPLREIYRQVIQRAGSRSRVRSLPTAPTIAGMKLAHALRISPLGPYHYKMIAESFRFDTTKIKRHLSWAPTLNNEQMLFRAYQYYHLHRREIEARNGASPQRKPADLGVIRLLKWLS